MNRKIARKRKKVSKKFMDKFWEGFPENRSVEKEQYKDLNFCKCTDSEGNILKAADVLFCNRDMLPEMRQNVEIVDGHESTYYNVYSPGVDFIFDKNGRHNFPRALETRNGTMYYKFSGKSGELLPYSAGEVEEYTIGLKGAAATGKTTFFLQTTSENFYNALAAGTSASFLNDTPKKSEAEEAAEEARKEFEEGVLPEPTRRGQIPPAHTVLATRGTGRGKRQMLIRVQDIDGQECVEDVSWNPVKYNFDMIFLMIGADDLLSLSEGKSAQCQKVIEELRPRLEVLRSQENADVEIMVIVTKADLLDQTNPYLKGVFSNSVTTDSDGKIVQLTHKKGFDMGAFGKRSRALKNYFKHTASMFFNNLISMVPEKNITFAAIASIGVECEEIYERGEYHPFCIDEPLLYVLNKQGLYPTKAKQGSGKTGEKTGSDGEKQKDFWERMWKVLGFPDEYDDEFDDELDDAYDEEYGGEYEDDAYEEERDEDMNEDEDEPENTTDRKKEKRRFKVYTGDEEEDEDEW